MRKRQFFLMLVLSTILAGSVYAEDDAVEREGERRSRGEFRQKLLEEFDDDGDGKLSDDEREAAREAMRNRREKEHDRERHRSPGRKGMPDPEKLFKQFDANGDNQLSREEFRKLAKTMREHHAKHRRGDDHPGKDQDRRSGPREGSKDKPGPPPKDRGAFDTPRAFQNPDDRPRPRRDLAERHRGAAPGGPGKHALHRHGPPDPDEVFDRFDKNGDDQLSREEFMELSDAMRRLRERFDREGGRRSWEGRGERRGRPDRKGHHDSDGARRPRPPGFHSEASSDRESQAAEDDSG